MSTHTHHKHSHQNGQKTHTLTIIEKKKNARAALAHLDRVADAEQVTDRRHVAPSVRADPRDVQHLTREPLMQFTGHLTLPAAAPTIPAARPVSVSPMVRHVPDQEVASVEGLQPGREIVHVVAIRVAIAGAVHRATDGCPSAHTQNKKTKKNDVQV